MKTTTLECVLEGDYLDHLRKQVEASHYVTNIGSRIGGNMAVARKYNMTGGNLSGVLRGQVRPYSSMLAQDGLEAVTVYVKREINPA